MLTRLVKVGFATGFTVKVIAPAKLTLSLHITGVRDDGYHLIDAEMVTLALHDTLEIAQGDSLAVLGNASNNVPADDSNLVRRALTLLGRSAAVRLHKRIPSGAGLGGASADAAAVLRWASCGDLQMAAKIGADVPFCLKGGRARVSGIGEIVEPLPFVARAITILIPPLHLSTKAVYQCWDLLGGPAGDNGNDLETAALTVAPELRVWRDRLADVSQQRPRLAGSGSSWWVSGEFPGPDRIVTHTVGTICGADA